MTSLFEHYVRDKYYFKKKEMGTYTGLFLLFKLETFLELDVSLLREKKLRY
jgi:hypothetical protein